MAFTVSTNTREVLDVVAKKANAELGFVRRRSTGKNFYMVKRLGVPGKMIGLSIEVATYPHFNKVANPALMYFDERIAPICFCDQFANSGGDFKEWPILVVDIFKFCGGEYFSKFIYWYSRGERIGRDISSKLNAAWLHFENICRTDEILLQTVGIEYGYDVFCYGLLDKETRLGATFMVLRGQRRAAIEQYFQHQCARAHEPSRFKRQMSEFFECVLNGSNFNPPKAR